jgi:aryl-alcohol dehydrogenase-like predicted oxidoreductase
MIVDTIEKIELGKTGIFVSQLGIGVWAWGDRLFWSYGKDYGENDIQQVYQHAVSAGINFFDTAEIYGFGQSEKLLGKLVPGTDDSLHIATKFFPFPWRLKADSLEKALRHSLNRLDKQRVALYQVHFPSPPRTVETWAASLGEAVEDGLTRTVGVSNYNREQMLRTIAVLQKRNIPLASNQVDYSLLQRKPEKTGLLQTCQELGITMIAYSPIAQGILTGKFSKENPLPVMRRVRYPMSILEKVQPLLGLMGEIGAGHGGRSLTQVAINWVICKGAYPIPGVKTLKQLEDVLGSVGWKLTADEVAALDHQADKLS